MREIDIARDVGSSKTITVAVNERSKLVSTLLGFKAKCHKSRAFDGVHSVQHEFACEVTRSGCRPSVVDNGRHNGHGHAADDDYEGNDHQHFE
jgi:hypothetical protein